MHTRSHMTKKKSLSLKRGYRQPTEAFKPSGLWYSIDDEWAEWCYGNMPEWVKKNSHYLDIDQSKILVIETLEDLQKFEERFSVNLLITKFTSINWKKVSLYYSGIEIRNYHQLKYQSSSSYYKRLWMYGWDVNGGCIWDLKCIKSFKVELTPNLSQIILSETDLIL